jgi:hypothetical protein
MITKGDLDIFQEAAKYQSCTFIFCGAEDQTQGLVHVKHSTLTYIPSSKATTFRSGKILPNK